MLATSPAAGTIICCLPVLLLHCRDASPKLLELQVPSCKRMHMMTLHTCAVPADARVQGYCQLPCAEPGGRAGRAGSARRLPGICLLSFIPLVDFAGAICARRGPEYRCPQVAGS